MTFVPYRSCATYSHIPIRATRLRSRVLLFTQNQKCYSKLQECYWLNVYSDILSVSPSISFSFSFSWEVKALEWPIQCPYRNVWNLFSASDHCGAACSLGNFGSTPIHPASLDNLEIQLLLLNMSFRPAWNAKVLILLQLRCPYLEHEQYMTVRATDLRDQECWLLLFLAAFSLHHQLEHISNIHQNASLKCEMRTNQIKQRNRQRGLEHTWKCSEEEEGAGSCTYLGVYFNCLTRFNITRVWRTHNH